MRTIDGRSSSIISKAKMQKFKLLASKKEEKIEEKEKEEKENFETFYWRGLQVYLTIA